MKQMTYRDLMLYILANHLEDEEVFKDGNIVGFMTAIEAAAKFEVGPATVKLWIERGNLPTIKLGNIVYIPENAKKPNSGPTELDTEMIRLMFGK